MIPFFESLRDKDTKTDFDILYNNNFGPHFHSNIEMIYVLDGNINITVNGTVYHLQTDDFMVIEPYHVHTYSSPLPSTLLFAICPSSHYKELTNPPAHCLQQCVYRKGRFSEEIKRCFYSIRDCVNVGAPLAAQGYIWAMISYIAAEYGWIDSPSNVNNNLFVELLQYLQQHYCEKITLDDLSTHFGYNKYYISKVFNRYVNMNFSEFVNSMRCHHAVELLVNNEMSITDIASESGFESLRSFHRSFQKLFDCTPSEYRRQACINSPKSGT